MKRPSIDFLLHFILCVICLNFSSLQASISKPFNSQEDADSYLVSHYNLGCEHYNRQEWRQAACQFEKVIYFFPCSDAAAEASYYLAVSYYKMKEYDFANEEFSNYLKASYHPAFFENAVYYKFCIAEHFKGGKKRRPFKMRYLPKWVSAQDTALTIYDEVVAALPNHELTIRALYSKAELLKRMREFRDCVDTYQMIIRRFPKDEIVPVCYLNISEAYFQQSRYEFQNPDILAFAELNLQKFQDDFPRDERVAIAEENLSRIKEMYAKGLCDVGLFYERLGHPEAAAIYFQSSIEEFPDTRVAQFCRARLICLGYATEETAATCDREISDQPEQPESCSEQQEAVVEKEMPEEEMPMGEKEVVPSEEESFSKGPEQSEFGNDLILAHSGEEIPPQEYVHYSLKKKRQASHTPFEPIDFPWEQDGANEQPESTLSEASPVDPNFEEDAPYLLHYSQLKRRDQNVAP
jgi:outer membrane protein assembly factor BamD (BamD/ComL family)